MDRFKIKYGLFPHVLPFNLSINERSPFPVIHPSSSDLFPSAHLTTLLLEHPQLLRIIITNQILRPCTATEPIRSTLIPNRPLALLALKLHHTISSTASTLVKQILCWPNESNAGAVQTYDMVTISPSTAVLAIGLEVTTPTNLAVYGWADVGGGGEGEGGEGNEEGGGELHVGCIELVWI